MHAAFKRTIQTNRNTKNVNKTQNLFLWQHNDTFFCACRATQEAQLITRLSLALRCGRLLRRKCPSTLSLKTCNIYKIYCKLIICNHEHMKRNDVVKQECNRPHTNNQISPVWSRHWLL